jgi:hypothetical protein
MSYEQTILQGFLSGVAGHGVTGLRSRVVRDIAATPLAPAHRVLALSRAFGDWFEPSQFVLTVGLGGRTLAAPASGSLTRFELMTWVDDLALAPDAGEGWDVMTALSALGRSLHAIGAWYPGNILKVGGGPGERDIGGWQRFLLARSMQPIQTEVGAVDVVRVLPVDAEEAAALQARGDAFGGWGFVTQRESENLAAVHARWRSPPRREAPPSVVLRAHSLVYEGAGDTLRVSVSGAPWKASCMREARLTLDANGFLVAAELVDDAGPRAWVAIGPPGSGVKRVSARVLQMDSGTILITMGAKRVRGHEPNPYAPWSLYTAG